MSHEDLTLIGLVVVPGLVAVCLGLFFRSFIGLERTWSVWAFTAAVLAALWLFVMPGTTP